MTVTSRLGTKDEYQGYWADHCNFPVLVKSRSSGAIVLAIGMSATTFSGMVVSGDTDDHVGYVSDEWRISLFEPYNGTVELSNKD